MTGVAVLLVCVLFLGELVSCSSAVPTPSDRVRVLGKTAAPAGWLDYCRRHQEDPACR